IRFVLSIIAPEEREEYLHFIYEDTPHFLQSGMRKQSHLFHFRGIGEKQSTLYQVTLLRSDFEENAHRFILIWQKMQPNHLPEKLFPRGTESAQLYPDTLRQLRIGRISFYNDNWYTLKSMGDETAAILEHTEEEIRTLFNGRLIETILPEDRKLVQQFFHDQLKSHGDAEMTFRIRQKFDRFLWVLLKCRLEIGSDGKEYLTGTVTDVHRSKMNQNKMQMDLKQYRALFANTQNVTYEWDMIEDTIHFSEQWYEIFGYHPKKERALAELSTNSHFHPEDITQLYGLIHNLQQGSPQQIIDVRIAKADGRYLWCRYLATAIHDEDGRLLKMVGIILNIDEEKRATKALQEKAERDSLTKLLNKTTTRQQAEEYISSMPNGAPCALLVIDLDNFKQVNDLYGHMFGDTLLESTAVEIKRLFRTQDIIGRIGGDEFMVLMRGTSDPDLAKSRCERLIFTLQNMFRSQLPDCNVGCSIGVAFAPDHGRTYYELFQRADQALYQVKRRGKNGFLFYNSTEISLLPQEDNVTALNARIDSDDAPELVYSNIVQYTFRHLYESGNVEAALQNVLEVIGTQLNISRVYIFENSEDNAYCNNTFEWCNEGVAPEIQNLQNISYEEDIPTFLENFQGQDVFCCSDVSALPRDLRDILEPQGIKSLLHCAIRDNGVFRGYVGFDDCKHKRHWTMDQINLLTFFSQMLSIILLKKRAQDATDRHAGNLRSILDSQNAWIYVIDPETCKLKFLNAKTLELAPEAKIGMHCYRALMGRESRCPGCPALNIAEEKTAEQILYNRHFQLHVLSEATLIQWENESSCMLTCREVKKEVM
ncbi:MAG: diguanylate cyclase, partial [Bacillota bacterium]|nr:diguanylate cyclase [Bacillota bacterium]